MHPTACNHTPAVARGLLPIPKQEEAAANAVRHFRHPVYDSVVVYRSWIQPGTGLPLILMENSEQALTRCQLERRAAAMRCKLY
jgi:hypothetical protein